MFFFFIGLIAACRLAKWLAGLLGAASWMLLADSCSWLRLADLRGAGCWLLLAEWLLFASPLGFGPGVGGLINWVYGRLSQSASTPWAT